MSKRRTLPILPSQDLIERINSCKDCYINETGARVHICCIDDVDEMAKLNKMHFDTPDESNDSYYGPLERDFRAAAFMNGWFQLTWLREAREGRVHWVPPIEDGGAAAVIHLWNTHTEERRES